MRDPSLKQRRRMAMLYYHAELRDYAVVGTVNKMNTSWVSLSNTAMETWISTPSSIC